MTQKQINVLPQNSRNFLAFADTVPGMQFVSSPNGQESQLRSGAQGASAINVFIDGVGQKNYVTPGGITGQDDSRGNPFPQSAIGEYKVITSNYKAEYDQIGSAAVTAVSKSGTNDFNGSFFWDRTGDDWRKPTVEEEKRGSKTEESTEQYGVSFGGPIIRDQLHFFVSYEAKDILTPRDVKPPTVFDPSVLPADLQALYGPANAPFKQNLYFGKLSWQANDSNLVELSMRYRDESSITGVGNENSVGFGTDFVNDETRVDLRYQFSSMNWLNDAHLTYEEAAYNPVPTTKAPGYRYTIVDPGNPGNRRLSVLNIGGSNNFQDKGQKGWAFQDDLTYFGWESHTIKMGVKYKQVDLKAFQQFPPYPQYFFDVNESLDRPYRVEYTTTLVGRDPFVESSNKQFGIYLQDDWEVNDKLTLNLGVRWDYEENPSYLDHRISDELLTALQGWANIQNTDYDVNDYIPNGNDRKSFKNAWQPRVGFSYDLFADQRHVIFGGAGRAYDRNLFDYMAREYYSGAFTTYGLDFDSPLHPCGSGCTAFSPALLTPEGLAAYAAANPRVGGEVQLLNNELKTPYSDQFSLGMRNSVSLWGQDWNTSVAISHIRSRDGIYFRLGNRYSDGRYYNVPGATWGGQPWGESIPGYGSLILGDNGIDYNLNSLLVSIDKPYTEASGWGVNLAYTYSDAEENNSNAAQGDENFVGDYPTIPSRMLLSTGVPEHRLVLSGIYDAIWDITLSGKLTLASHRPRYAINCRDAVDWNNCFFDPFVPKGTIGYKQFDLAAEKVWSTGTDVKLRVRADMLNVFNWRNWNQFTDWRGGVGEALNPNFAERSGDEILLPTRTFKLSFGLDW